LPAGEKKGSPPRRTRIRRIKTNQNKRIKRREEEARALPSSSSDSSGFVGFVLFVVRGPLLQPEGLTALPARAIMRIARVQVEGVT